MTQSTFEIKFPNFTQMPNILFDEWLPKLRHAELLVLLAIYRKTFGYHKSKDQISLSQLMKLTGLAKQHIVSAATKLEHKKLVKKIVSGKNGNQQTIYEIITSEEQETSNLELPVTQSYRLHKVTGNVELQETGNVELPPPGNIKLPTKETNINKEEKKKESKPKKTEQSSLASEEAHDSSFFSNIILELIDLLLKSILSVRRNFKITSQDKKNWAIEIDRMIRLDKRDVTEIKAVLAWLMTNEFWQKNILSGSKLRKQFDKLAIEMNNDKEKAFKAKKNSSGISSNPAYTKYKPPVYKKHVIDFKAIHEMMGVPMPCSDNSNVKKENNPPPSSASPPLKQTVKFSDAFLAELDKKRKEREANGL